MSKPVSILLVEDDDKLRSTIQDYMQMNGFQVTACPDGVTALRQFRYNGEGVDIILLGGTSAGLDIHLHPKQDMEGGSVTLAQGVGGQKRPSRTQCMPGTMWLFWRLPGNARGTA